MSVEQRAELGDDARARVLGARLRRALRRAREHGGHVEPLDGVDERGVEHGARQPEAGDPDAQAHPHEPSMTGR